MIVSPNSFVHRCQAISASKVQMSAALNQQPDALHRQARLHRHRERGLWPTEGDGGQEGWQVERWKWKSTLIDFILSLNTTCRLFIWMKRMNLYTKSKHLLHHTQGCGPHLHCQGHENLNQDLYRGLLPFSLLLQSECNPGTSSDWPERRRREEEGTGCQWVEMNTTHQQCATDTRRNTFELSLERAFSSRFVCL